MDKLSPEILSLIVDHLDTHRLSSYATISRAWQLEIQRRCFRTLELNVESMAAFPEMFSRLPYRRTYLRRINLALHQEKLKEDKSVSHYVPEQMIFRRCLFSLLATLKQWEEDEDTAGSRTPANLELCIKPTERTWDPDDEWDSPLQNPRLSYLLEDPATATILRDPAAAVASDPWLGFHDLTLPVVDHDEQLPVIQTVQALSVEGGKGNFLYGPVFLLSIATCEIAAAFPSLKSLQFEYRDGFRSNYDLQETHRSALVCGLLYLRGKLLSLEKLEIKRISPDCVLNHNYYPDHMDADGIDPVGEAIRQLAQPTVQELVLDNFFLSRNLLCSRRSNNPEDEDTWRALRRLDVRAQLVAPDGEWYTTGAAPTASKRPADGPLEGVIDSIDGDVACTPWRRCIDSSTTESLLHDLTKTAHDRMPCLRDATIDLHNDTLDDYLYLWGWSDADREVENREDWDDLEARLRVSCRSQPKRQWTVDRHLGARECDIPRRLQILLNGLSLLATRGIVCPSS